METVGGQADHCLAAIIECVDRVPVRLKADAVDARVGSTSTRHGGEGLDHVGLFVVDDLGF